MVDLTSVVMWRTVVVVATVVSVVVSEVDYNSDQTYITRRHRPRQQCSGYCKVSSKFQLVKGKTYVYQYEGVVSTGVSWNTSLINITAEAHLRVEDNPCDLTLLVRNAHLYDSGPSGLEESPQQSEWATRLEQWPLRLSYQDGRVDQLCPAAEEFSWVLDFKRAILSALQNSMPDLSSNTHLHERDVSGTCETTYTVSPTIFGDMEVLRRKELHSCSGRGPHTLGLSGALPSSTPIVRSEQICKQRMSDNDGRHISRVECYESHVFSPFSNGQAGLRTQVNLTLALIDIIKSEEILNADLFVNRRTSLKGEFIVMKPEILILDKDVEVTLDNLSSYSQQGVDEHVPQFFDQLVRQMTSLDDQQLVKIFDNIEKKRTRKFFLDALPLVGTSGSVKAMYQIYTAEEVSRDELEAWLSALAFHKYPTLEMLNTLNLLMQEGGDHPKTWLAIGAVVHAYCQHDAACQDTPEVNAILASLSSNLGQSCHITDKEQQQLVVATLKAIGNAGIIPSVKILNSCFMNDNNPLEVRLAALSSTRRMPCNLQDQMPFTLMFLKRDQDSELRIAAYLASMQCPSTTTLSYIRESLQMDDVNQVLSFVWTHLTNLQESRSTWKKEIREMLQDSYLANKFKTDVRKFSRNYEMSIYSDILKMGATIDSNVLFSTKSYLPRSANLNLTIDLFGEALNLFEVGTRLEGFESIVEDLFSPAGYFPDESLRTMVKNMRSSESDKTEVIQSMAQKFNKGIVDEPQGLIFARIFGNELYLTQFSSLDKLLEVKKPEKYSGKFFSESLKSLFDHKQIDYTKSFKVINSQYTLPTVVGLPLKVEVNGTAAVSFVMKTELDVQKILKTQSGDVSLFINPSAVLEVDGKMTVDAVFAQAGVETKGILKTNTYIDFKLSLEKGKVLDIIVNVPREKAEVIDVQSVVYVRHREQLIELGGVGEVTQWDTCSGDQVPTLSGMRICSQMELRNATDVQSAPYFPLTGRFHYSLALQKSDSFDAYHLHWERRIESLKGNNKRTFIVAMDTPGSKLNRTLSAKLLFNSEGSSVDASLDLISPWARMDLSGQLVMTEAEMALNIRTRVGNSQVVATRMGVRREINNQNVRLEPSLVIQSEPWNVNFNMSGHLEIAAGKRYSAGLSVHNPTQVLSFAGEVTKDNGRYSGAIALKAARMDVNVNGRLVNTPSLFSCKAQANYKIGAGLAEDIEFSTKLQSNFKHSLTKRHLVLNIQMSEWPYLSTKASWILHQGDHHFDSKTDLIVGRTQWRQQLTYINNLHEQDKTFEVTVNLGSPTKHLDYKAQIIYKTGEEFLHTHLLAQLSKETQFISLFDLKRDGPLHELELKLASPWNQAALEAKMEAPFTFHTDRQINGTVIVKWGNKEDPQWLSVGGKYLVKETAMSAQHRLVGWLEGREWETPMQLEGDWTAKAAGGLIQSVWKLKVSYNDNSYSTSAYYLKEPLFGKHNLKVDLVLPEQSYSGRFYLINKMEIKNITVELNLEKNLYFTSQLQGDEQLQMQLFWNYLGDQSQNVLVQYKSSGQTELAIISMPGHYASLTIDKLGQGLSSMNITAVWGESKGSANNAILLSTYWMLDTNPDHSTTLPTVHTKIHLTTPFIGFEHQSFEFHMNGSSFFYGYPLIKSVHMSTRWQDQFLDLNINQISKIIEADTYDKPVVHTTISGEVSSSLEFIRAAAVKFELMAGQTYLDNIIISAAYNKQATLTFNSLYTASQLAVSVLLTDMVENITIFSGDLSVVDHAVQFKATLPENKCVSLDIDYYWPNKFKANLITPIDGYEVASLEYHIRFDNNNVETRLSGKTSKQFAMFSAKIHTLDTSFNGQLNITSSSSMPDLTVTLDHEFSLSNNELYMKDFAAVILKKNGQTIQSGQALVSFKDEKSSLSSKTKSLQTVLQLPGHYSSSNYSYQTQVKITGVDEQHHLTHLWNTEKTEVSVLYEGLKFISGFFKRNDEKIAELYFKKMNNQNCKTEVTLPGAHFLHNFYVISWTNWENLLTISTPKQSVVIKNVQTMNAEKTNYIHKSTFNLNKELSYVDLAVNLDEVSGRVNNIMFLTTSPWSDPLTAKYDLIVSTGPTSKHAIELKFQQNKEVKAEFDVTSIDSKLEASFNLFSPFCKQLGGSVTFECNEVNLKTNGFFILDNNQVSLDMELIKNPKKPKVEFNFNSTNKNILHFSCNYDVTKTKKEATLKTSYLERIVYLNGHYTVNNNQFQAGLIGNSPFSSWKEIAFDSDAVISEKYSMFKINMRKEDNFILLTGTGTFQRDLIKTSVSLDYEVLKDIQKHAAIFELGTGQESGFITFQLMNNEINVLEFSIKGFTQSEKINAQKSYVLHYKAIMPIENFQNSSVEIKYTCNSIKCELTGNTSVNSWQALFKGECTFNKDSFEYLDFKVVTGGENIECYIKHKDDVESDIYTWYLSRNDNFISGAMSMPNITNGLELNYSIESSIKEIRIVSGNVLIESSPTSFNIITLLKINEETDYAFIYNAILTDVVFTVIPNRTENKYVNTEHRLRISVPLQGFENIVGNLKYGLSDGVTETVEGNITTGNITNTVSIYNKLNKRYSNVSIDLPNVLTLTAWSIKDEDNVEVIVNIVPNDVSISNCSLNLTIDLTGLVLFKMSKDSSELLGSIKTSENKVIVSGTYNNNNINVILKKSQNSISLECTSSIPNWKEMSLEFSNKNKCIVSVTKEKQAFLYSELEMTYRKSSVLLTLPTLFVNIDAGYDFLSNLSVIFKTNINGSSQHFEGTVNFLQDSTQISLATPIQGFEDLTLISNLNRNDRKAGLTIYNKEKRYEGALSMSVKSRVVELQGAVLIDKDEFTLSIGAQNGTDEEPKSNSIYISAFKNKLSVFWLSLEGFYNLDKKAGIKLSFSSYYYNQILLEALSLKTQLEHNLFLNYISGNDIVYLFNSTITKDLLQPQLLIESRFGTLKNAIQMQCNNYKTRKAIVFQFKQNDNKFMKILGETSIGVLASETKFVLENKDLLPVVQSVNIFGAYNFTKGTLINSSLFVDNIKYFDLFMESNSLYNVNFLSFVKPSEYINHTYNISLIYQLGLPLTEISSYVNINSDYYKCVASFLWDKQLATTVFQLTTNAGYGFENALLNAKFKLGEVNYHMMDFTIDESTLFHVACDITYPSLMSIELDLPDTLFLPYVKTIRGEYRFTESEKKVELHYKSGSSDQRQLDALILFNKQRYTIKFGISNKLSENVIQSSTVAWTFNFVDDNLVFRTCVIWKNNTLFTLFYRKTVPDDFVQAVQTLPNILFGLENNYSWNVTSTQFVTFKFDGSLNSSDISLFVRHPSTVYHNQIGISEVKWTKSIGSTNFLQAYYKNEQTTEWILEYSDFLQLVGNLVLNHGKAISYDNMKVNFTDWVLSINKETTCDKYSQFGQCLKFKHLTEITGLAEGSQSLFFEVDLISYRFKGSVSTPARNITFGGNANVNGNVFMCCNASLYFTLSDMPDQPFSFIYESDGKNIFYGSLNIFEKNAREMSISIEKLSRINKLSVNGTNIPYLNCLAITSEFSGSSTKIKGNLDKDNFNIQLKYTQNIHSLELESSFEALKILKVTHEMDDSKRSHSGIFKIEGSKIVTEWVYFTSLISDGLVVLNIESDKGVKMRIELDLDNKKEINLQLIKNGKLYEGKGTLNMSIRDHTLLGEGSVSIDGKLYKLSIQNTETLLEHKSAIKLMTPTEHYFIEAHMNVNADQNTPFVNLAYKTPIYPFKFGDINIWYSTTPVNHLENVLIGEKNISNSINYNEKVIGLSLTTEAIKLDNLKLIVIHGEKKGLLFNYMSKKIEILHFQVISSENYVLKSVVDVEGFNIPAIQFLIGKTSIKAYVDKSTKDCFASIETPAAEKVLFISESSIIDKQIKDFGGILFNYEEHNHTSKLVIGHKTYILFNLQNNNVGQYNGSLYAEAPFEKAVNLRYTIEYDRVNIYVEFSDSNKTIVDTGVLYLHESTAVNSWSKSFQIFVKRFFSVPEKYLINCKVNITQEVNDKSIVIYKLNFTNGITGPSALSGNCSVSLPDIQSFSLDSKPSIIFEIDLDTLSSEYSARANIYLQRKQLEASMTWRGQDKLSNSGEQSEFDSLEFGGVLKDSSVELYLNDNKLLMKLENIEDRTNISAYLTLEKLEEPIYFVTTIKYSPIFMLNISQTMFPTPCSVEFKIDLRDQLLESALNILYNGLEQQAFVNVYLDTNPRYVELIYIDIWKQTHDVSVHVDERDDEVSLTGKINSPALDENFLIVTLGKNNDRFDLNMNDDLVIKAFNDESRVLLDLHFGNEYKINVKSGNEVEISIASPGITGKLSLKLTETASGSLIIGSFYSEQYSFNLGINTDKLFEVTFKRGEENIFNSLVVLCNSNSSFEFEVEFNVFEYANGFAINHISDPINLILSLNSSYFVNTSLLIEFAKINEIDTNVIKGIFELKREEKLISSCLQLNKKSRTLIMSFEAPLFSEMDEVKINGILNIGRGDIDVNITVSLISAKQLLFQANIYLIKHEIFASGLVINSKFKNYEKISLSFTFPLVPSGDMKANLLIQLPKEKSYEVGFTVCLRKDIGVASAVARWQDAIIFIELKKGVSPFYSDLIEMTLQYKKTTLLIGAWISPKYPITDCIYFLDVDDRRIVEVSHSLVLQDKHYKSKLIVHTVFKGHEKYGIDCELNTVENSSLGKIVKILASAPKFGNDLGIHIGFIFDSMLNYTLLAQIRIPYNNDIKIVRLYSLQQIHPNLNFSKINHSMECTGLGKFGWELSVHGPSPFIWETEMASLETKVFVNDNIYSLYTKSHRKPNSLDFALEIKTPFDRLNQSAVQFCGFKGIVGSELMVSFNSENIIRITVTEDSIGTKEFDIYSKWRSIAGKYFHEENNRISGYICWNLAHKETSQLGLSLVANEDDNTYQTGIQIILPSMIFSKISVNSTLEMTNENIYSQMKVEFPGLNLEGHILKENSQKLQSDITWSVSGGPSKHISLSSTAEPGVDETKYYFILQHFALANDLIVTFYTKHTLYGMNLQYSLLKEDEITMEFGYWLENGKSGVKFVALHPSSNTLFFGVANKTETVDLTEAGLTMSYLSDQDTKKIKYVEVYGKKSKKIPQLLIGVTSNGNNLAVGGTLWKKENFLQGITLEARINQKDPLKLEIVQNISEPGVEMELSYGVSRSYRMAAGMPSSNEITAQISHTVYGRPILDALASLRLNTSKILWGRFQLPPLTQVGQELYSNIAAEYSDVNLVSEAIVHGFFDFAHEDFAKKALLLLNGVSSTTEVLVYETYSELGVIKDKIEAISDIAKKAYKDDHLYLKTCHLLMKQIGQVLYVHVNQGIQVLSCLVDSVLGPVWSIMQQVWQVIESILSQWKMLASDIGVEGVTPLRDLSQVVAQYQLLRANIFQYIRLALHDLQSQLDLWQCQWVKWMAQAEVRANELIDTVQKTLEVQIRRLLNYKDTVLAGFTVLGDTIAEMMEIVVDGVYDIKEVRYAVNTLVDSFAELKYWLTQFRLEEYLREFNAFFDRVIQLVVEDFNKNFGEYEEYIVKAKLVLEGSFEEISKLPQVRHLHATVNHIYLKTKWFWNYANFNHKLKEVVQEFIENVKEMLEQWEKLLDQEEGDLRSEYEYNAENNSLTFTQELPFEWRAFNELPYNWKHNMYSNQGPLKSKAQEYMILIQKVAQSMWQDTKLLPSLLPPFSAVALFTPHNIMTFDNTFYYFSGDCRSFLLAGDLRHNTFSLIADYYSQNERDLILIVKNMAVTIKDNLKVYINDSLVELPTKLSGGFDLSIERKLNSILIESKRGFSLECSSYLDMCTFKLSGWYVGKTAGLLGTYNNEHYDDYYMLQHKKKEYIDSWALSSSSCESNNQLSFIVGDTLPIETRCEQMFLSHSSSLAPCFYEEDPNVFHQMCITQSTEDNSCASIYAYVTKCTAAGVQLEFPEFCGGNSLFNMTEHSYYSEYSDEVQVTSEMSADIVFVVESTASCSYSDSVLTTRLVLSLTNHLEDRQLTNNNFALVSFNARGVHIHTFNGQLWTHDETQLAAVIGAMDEVDNADEESKYVTALQTAASLHFRPSASKVVILLHCSLCPSLPNLSPPLLQSLLQNDAVVHVVQKDSLLNRQGKPVSKVIGFERSGAYLRNLPTKISLPNPQLLKQISVPQDLCTPLALGTNGTVFSLDKRVKVWAARVANGAVPTLPRKLCENTTGYDNVPVWRCHSFRPYTKNKDYDQMIVDEYMDTSPSEAYTEYGDVDR